MSTALPSATHIHIAAAASAGTCRQLRALSIPQQQRPECSPFMLLHGKQRAWRNSAPPRSPRKNPPDCVRPSTLTTSLLKFRPCSLHLNVNAPVPCPALPAPEQGSLLQAVAPAAAAPRRRSPPPAAAQRSQGKGMRRAATLESSYVVLQEQWGVCHVRQLRGRTCGSLPRTGYR